MVSSRADPTRTEDFVAEGDLLTDVGGTLPHKVLSTPGMIHVMEWACTRLIREAVPHAGPTVGGVSGRCSWTRRAHAHSMAMIIPGVESTFDGSVPPTSVSRSPSATNASSRTGLTTSTALR